MKMIWAQKWQVLPVAKLEGKKNVFQIESFKIDSITAYQSQMASIRLDFEFDKPRMKTDDG